MVEPRKTSIKCRALPGQDRGEDFTNLYSWRIGHEPECSPAREPCKAQEF